MYQNRIRAAVAAVVTTTVLAVPAVAAAHVDHSIARAGASATYGHDVGHGHIKRHHRIKRHVRRGPHAINSPGAAPTAPATTPGATHAPALMEADDNNCTADNVVAFLQAHDASVLRLVITPNFDANWAGCITAAQAAGYKIYLSVWYDPTTSIRQTVAYFRQVIATYGAPWAMSIGNEETIGNAEAADVAHYLADWAALEPVIATLAPGTIRVVGEEDPWGVKWTADVMAAHPAGAQVASFHCYNTAGGGGLASVVELAADAAQDGYPFWCSEMAPRTDPNGFAGVALQTVGQWQAANQATFNQAPNLQLASWYEWPSIGAITPGV